jgi:hypothetical protein
MNVVETERRKYVMYQPEPVGPSKNEHLEFRSRNYFIC